MRVYRIVAVTDVSQSEFSKAERRREIECRNRLVELDEDEEPANRNVGFIGNRCLKYALAPVNGDDLVVGFEFDGPIPFVDFSVKNAAFSDLIGCLLEIDDSRIEIIRGTLLLRQGTCRIRQSNSNNRPTPQTNQQNISNLRTHTSTITHEHSVHEISEFSLDEEFFMEDDIPDAAEENRNFIVLE